MGVDAIKTDFGERIPMEGIVYHDGSDPVKMHNFYPVVYNETVFRAIEAKRGRARLYFLPALPTPRVNGFPCTGAVTAGQPSSRWPSRSAAACRSAYAASASGVTTLAASRAPRPLTSTNAGPPSACSPPTAGCTAARAIGSLGVRRGSVRRAPPVHETEVPSHAVSLGRSPRSPSRRRAHDARHDARISKRSGV